MIRGQLGRRFESARLSLLQVRVATNERDEPLWPRPLTPRGAAMLLAGVLAIRRGLSYLRQDAPPTTLTYLDALLPTTVVASLWIVAAALIIVLGPTRWWRWGIDVVIYLHVVWALNGYFTYYGGVSTRGDITGDLYAQGAAFLFAVRLMLNPPRPNTLPGAPHTTGPWAPARRGKGRSDG